MLVSLDFDEILFPLMEPFLVWLKAKHFSGLKLRVEDVDNYDLKPWFKGRTAELIEDFYFSKDMQDIKPEPGAVAGVKAIHAAGHKTVIVTGRPSFCDKQTQAQLVRHFPLMPIHFTNQFYDDKAKVSKRDVCMRLGAKIHVDDMIRNVNDCAKAGIKSIFVRRPWRFKDQPVGGVIIVDDWNGILSTILARVAQ